MAVFDPRDIYLWLNGQGGVEKEKAGAEFWANIEQNPHTKDTLVSVFDNEADWSVWERHPVGDEVLVALSGEVIIQLELPSGVQDHVMKAGDAFVIPAGVWHTAKVKTPGRMLFLTFGEGTEHRPL